MKYSVGQVVQGTITGIQPYGAFVKIDDDTTGMIHISEISDNYVNDVHRYVKQGEKVIVKIIDNSNGKLRLSLKAVQPQRRGRIPIRMIVTRAKYPVGFSSLKEKLNQWIKEEVS